MQSFVILSYFIILLSFPKISFALLDVSLIRCCDFCIILSSPKTWLESSFIFESITVLKPWNFLSSRKLTKRPFFLVKHSSCMFLTFFDIYKSVIGCSFSPAAIKKTNLRPILTLLPFSITNHYVLSHLNPADSEV